jgi:hypothetical protein
MIVVFDAANVLVATVKFVAGPANGTASALNRSPPDMDHHSSAKTFVGPAPDIIAFQPAPAPPVVPLAVNGGGEKQLDTGIGTPLPPLVGVVPRGAAYMIREALGLHNVTERLDGLAGRICTADAPTDVTVAKGRLRVGCALTIPMQAAAIRAPANKTAATRRVVLSFMAAFLRGSTDRPSPTLPESPVPMTDHLARH